MIFVTDVIFNGNDHSRKFTRGSIVYFLLNNLGLRERLVSPNFQERIQIHARFNVLKVLRDNVF